MRRLFANKWFIVVLITVLLVAIIILGAIPNSPVNKILTPVKAVANPIQRFVKSVGTTIDDYWAAITDGVAIREENVALKEEIARLEYEATKDDEAMIRYEELKDAFHIKDSFSDYDIFGASVLSREADEWFSVIRVGAGIDDGLILENTYSYAVVDNRTNLIGRVIETNSSESKILPLLHEGFSVNGKVNEVNGAVILVSGDAALKKQGLCLVTGIGEDVVIEVGDVIVTSGDGGLFPQGIPIGEIYSVDYSDSLHPIATLIPYASIDDLKDVFIMVPYNQDVATETPVTEETNE
ncbi:MAG: rod shape-determining protein MreC [Clostridia bacterium]|nr:rod shape-determining protein MreC [Clostridia bacterium]